MLQFRCQNIPEYELFGFHGTGKTNPTLLCQTDVNLSFAQDGFLGYGFYVSENAFYTLQNFAHKLKNGYKQFLGVIMLPGRVYHEPTHNISRGKGYRSPPKNYESRSLQLPSGLIYAVYRPEQVLCSYIITVK